MKRFAPLLLIGLAFVAFETTIAHADNFGMGTTARHPSAPPSPRVVSTELGFAFTGQVDHIANGVGLRNRDRGTIRLQGAPATARAVVGILYFGFICDGPCPFSQAVKFRGVPVTSILIATAPQPCWAGDTYGAYSVDVTFLLRPRINGEYLVAGVPSSLTDGSDPWISPVILPLAEERAWWSSIPTRA